MRHLPKSFVAAVAVSLLVAACGSSSSKTTSSAASGETAPRTSSASAAVVKTATNAKLGTVLVDSQGMTLYHLSGERGGKFICSSSACVGVWHPLTVSSVGTPSGEVGSLATVKRPDGTVQVTYKGAPLYTFAQDRQSGEANGQGIKDVGTWSAITISSASAPASTNTAPSTNTTPSTSTTPTTPAPSSGGGSGGYGY
jgi:predicted lipoprotein with Yx(FWY)xxD motif